MAGWRRLQMVAWAMAALVLHFGFVNCSEPVDFLSASNRTSKQSGGEGYGGKPYLLVSPSDDCPGSKLKPSELSVMPDLRAYLVRKDCQVVDPPVLVNVVYSPIDVSILTYNGQIYRDAASSAPFEPVPAPQRLIALDVETQMQVVQSTGAGVVDEFWLIANPNAARQNVQFPAAGEHVFTVRAKGESGGGVGAKMVLRIDGVAYAEYETSEVAGEYTWRANVGAGVHEVAIAFTNDTWNSQTRIDRNLLLDWLRIAK